MYYILNLLFMLNSNWLMWTYTFYSKLFGVTFTNKLYTHIFSPYSITKKASFKKTGLWRTLEEKRSVVLSCWIVSTKISVISEKVSFIITSISDVLFRIIHNILILSTYYYKSFVKCKKYLNPIWFQPKISRSING